MAEKSLKTPPPAGAVAAGAEDVLPLDKVIARPDLWFYPGERLAADEMRVILMGTGWGNIIRPKQALRSERD
jgi:hypothetical protein